MPNFEQPENKSKYHINESGEIIRTADAPEREKNVEFELAHMHDSFGAQSVPPEGVEVPEDTFFWKGDRLNHYKDLFLKFNGVVEENGITEIVHPARGVKIVVSDFIDKIQRSIDFSENVRNPESQI
jgi:hypothetical protein